MEEFHYHHERQVLILTPLPSEELSQPGFCNHAIIVNSIRRLSRRTCGEASAPHYSAFYAWPITASPCITLVKAEIRLFIRVVVE